VEAIGRGDRRAGGRDVVSVGFVIFGLYLVGIALFAAVAPGTFFDETGRFGPRNNHYIELVGRVLASGALIWLLARATRATSQRALG
jgi:hypothetical protein